MTSIELEEDFARKMGMCHCCGSHYGIAAKPPFTEWGKMAIFWTCFDCGDDCKQPPCPHYNESHKHVCEDDPNCPIHNGSLDNEIERNINLFVDFLQAMLKEYRVIESRSETRSRCYAHMQHPYQTRVHDVSMPRAGKGCPVFSV